jgi:hypothetical protein
LQKRRSSTFRIVPPHDVFPDNQSVDLENDYFKPSLRGAEATKQSGIFFSTNDWIASLRSQ